MPARKTLPTSISHGRAPAVLESEQAALGCALRDTESAELIISELQSEDFYSGKTGAVFKAMRDLSESGLTINPVSVAERSGTVRQEIEELVDRAQGVTSSQLKTIISDIRRVGALRNIYTACSNASSSIGRDSKLEEVTDLLERGLYKANRDGNDEAKDGSDVMSKVIDDFMARHRLGGGPEISTGLKDLDRALIGLRPGKVGIIAARPSMGKTALARTIGRAVLAQGHSVIEFNLEMDAEELIERELAFQASIDLRKVMSARGISEEEILRVEHARTSLVSQRWYIDDRAYSIAGMRRKARIIHGRMARAGVKVGVIIIDYLQLAGENGDGREQSIAAISRGTKFMAKELGCTVLALSQLNRSCEYREDKRPIMSDLRESGSIEQDADWIGFVYREHMYDNTYPAEDTEFIIRKQRSGPTGTVRLHYSPKIVTFSDRKDVIINVSTPTISESGPN